VLLAHQLFSSSSSSSSSLAVASCQQVKVLQLVAAAEV